MPAPHRDPVRARYPRQLRIAADHLPRSSAGLALRSTSSIAIRARRWRICSFKKRWLKNRCSFKAMWWMTSEAVEEVFARIQVAVPCRSLAPRTRSHSKLRQIGADDLGTHGESWISMNQFTSHWTRGLKCKELLCSTAAHWLQSPVLMKGRT